ncbi:TFIIH basal transcription factor complex subunit SSL1 [Vararia minispora EC-137]|uniref:TFIIH basal transcription factor complex subunit SSL1 n=1 Tax=Vararia minispora EC-137 TaxID=1314806 RepID=A0ACB8QW36_9AGAM|nr:TFIIH basal transcription factor complex subunit SSL1 [Vararia minispora EC-137]
MPPRRTDVDSGSDSDSFDESSKKAKGKTKAKEGAYAWEAKYTRSWDTVQEDEGGSLQGTVEGLIARRRRRRLLEPTAAVRRTIVRHLFLLIDLSDAMRERDLRPTRLDLTLQCARAFVTEWFDQNPLGQIGIGAMRGGLGDRIVEMTGNPQDVLTVLGERHRFEPSGEPSLQNALEMARSAMSHLPNHASREVLVIYSALTTVDPGDIMETLAACVRDRIRVSVVALAAEMRICRELCEKTGGTFSVAMNEGHFKDLLFELVPPPALRTGPKTDTRSSTSGADLMLMGFPTRLPASAPAALCSCHGAMRRAGFLCPRCRARLCDVPTDCPVCGIMVVSAPHLARSFHHLFPVKPYAAVYVELFSVYSLSDSRSSEQRCHACSVSFPTQTQQHQVQEGMSPFGRYRCPTCSHDFCPDCDVFVHDVLHTCPGCEN